MAKRKPVHSAPHAPTPAWWDDSPHAESALKAITEAGHRFYERRPTDTHTGFIGIVYNDTTLKRPGEFYDLELFTLSDLNDFAQLGKNEFLRMRKVAEHKRLARVYTVKFTDQTTAQFDALLPMKQDLARRFEENGTRALEITEKNPFTDESFDPIRAIYGYWLWAGEERFNVALRPASESPPKLPSCWLRTL